MKLLISFASLFLSSCSSFSQNGVDKEKSTSFTFASREFLRNKQYDSAWYSIGQALKYDPENWAAYNNRAILKYRTGASDNEIVADFKKALELKPDYEISLYSVANYYDETRQYQKAITACDNYIKLSQSNDFDSVEAIHRLRQLDYEKLAETQKIIDGVSVRQARLFYDSISTAINEPLPVEQRFIDKLGKAMLAVLNNKDVSSIEIDALRAGLDSSKNLSALKIGKITRISEIDTSIGYKQIVLDYELAFDKAFKGLFTSYIDDLNTKDVSIIRQSSKNLQIPLREIKQKELMFKQAQSNFRMKYGIYEE